MGSRHEPSSLHTRVLEVFSLGLGSTWSRSGAFSGSVGASSGLRPTVLFGDAASDGSQPGDQPEVHIERKNMGVDENPPKLPVGFSQPI